MVTLIFCFDGSFPTNTSVQYKIKVLANRFYHEDCVEQSEASEVQNNKQSVHLFTDGRVRDGQK